MYATLLFAGFTNCVTVQPVVAIERTVFYRERAAGMYSTLPYTFAQVEILADYFSSESQVLALSSSFSTQKFIRVIASRKSVDFRHFKILPNSRTIFRF